MTLETPVLLCFPHLSNASSPRLVRGIWANPVLLVLPHARVDIYVFDSDIQWTVSWPDEPAVNLPTQV